MRISDWSSYVCSSDLCRIFQQRAENLDGHVTRQQCGEYFGFIRFIFNGCVTASIRIGGNGHRNNLPAGRFLQQRGTEPGIEEVGHIELALFEKLHHLGRNFLRFIIAAITNASRVILGDGLPGEHATDDCAALRSEEHTSELQSLMRTSNPVFCLEKKN